MTVEVMPIGVKCNIGCTYCYQQPMRDHGSLPTKPYNIEAMKATLAAHGEPFTVFGGEALMIPIADLEELWKFGYEKFKQNDVQTNAVLVTDEHIALFKKYNVRVGVSIDGPGELNDARRAGNLEQTREATAKSIANFEKLLGAGVSNSLILTLHSLNASPPRLPLLLEWVRSMTFKGLRYVRLHPMEVDSGLAKAIELSDEHLAAAMLAFRDLSLECELYVEEFHDIANLLRGTDQKVTCIWNACDPWTTSAVQAVDGQGHMKNCARTNKDGRDWAKAKSPGYMRQVVLYNTPYEDGGCQGCRFFVACKGSCPGHSIDGDWRNRPRECRVWMTLFEAVEKDLYRLYMLGAGPRPVSRRPDRKNIEEAMLSKWAAGQRARICDAAAPDSKPSSTQNDHGDQHGDHTDYAGALASVKGELVK